ncbi:MAG TPA: radical SAM protein, partial [Deltaproteobacteria bacterium]|nr:radical SAM protein [Deltaproteobacteria bacterium]
TYVYLLFGTPAEDEASARKTLEFTADHAGYIDFLNLSVFNLPRGGDEAAGLDTYDFFEGDLSLYQGFVHPKGWDRNRVRRFLDREFRRNPAVAAIVRNDPPLFTSNHAPFFVKTPHFFAGIS